MSKRCRYILIAAAALAACGGSEPVKTPVVPDNLKAPLGSLLTLQASAKGAQVYVCKAGANGGYQWSLKAPDAILFDQTGKKIARHYAGPTWEADDGSLVVGEVASRADSPDGKSIPWLLLKAKSNSGRGRFGSVRYIQRLHTLGGSAPPSCSTKELDEELRVKYTADYYFFVESRS